MISSNCPTCKIGFAAGIEFNRLKTVEKKIKEGIIVSDYSCNIETAKNGRLLGTPGIFMCNAGGITGGNTDSNLLFHLFPKYFFNNLHSNLKILENKFTETITLLKKEHKIPQGLIFGGDSRYDDSKDLMVILKHFFDKFKIDHTVFWGTRSDSLFSVGKSIFYGGNNDTWMVNCSSRLKLKDIINSFDYIRVSESDKVKFSDTGWISGKDGSLNKGQIDLTIEDVLKKYGVDPKILKTL